MTASPFACASRREPTEGGANGLIALAAGSGVPDGS